MTADEADDFLKKVKLQTLTEPDELMERSLNLTQGGYGTRVSEILEEVRRMCQERKVGKIPLTIQEGTDSYDGRIMFEWLIKRRGIALVSAMAESWSNGSLHATCALGSGWTGIIISGKVSPSPGP